MPFDNPPANRKREILEDMSRILARPESWSQGARGRPAGTMCIIEALEAATQDYYERQDVAAVLGDAVNLGPLWITWFNDRPETTHSDILAWIERAKERVG